MRGKIIRCVTAVGSVVAFFLALRHYVQGNTDDAIFAILVAIYFSLEHWTAQED